MRKKKKYISQLNTSSLPDLIFTVLFFFMIVTHMRENNTEYPVHIPAGKQLQKIEKQFATTNLYIYFDKENNIKAQINSKQINIEDIASAISIEKNNLSDDILPYYTVCLRADKKTPIHIIAQIKQSLQQAGVLNLTFIATPTE